MEREASLKGYYKTLDLEEGASLEEITTRWLEFKKEYQFAAEKDDAAVRRMKEINEAYRVLKASVPRADEFEIEKYVKKGVLSRQAERNSAKKKMVVFSSGVLAICLISAFVFTLTKSPGTDQLPSADQADPNRITRGPIQETAPLPPGPKPPVMTAKTSPQEFSKTLASQDERPIPIPKESPSSVNRTGDEAKGKEQPAPPPALKPSPPVEVAKAARPEASKTGPPKDVPRIAAPKGSPAESAMKAIAARAKEKPGTAPASKPASSVELARVAPEKSSKTTISEVAPSIPVSKESSSTFVNKATEATVTEKPTITPPLKTEPFIEAARAASPEQIKTITSEDTPLNPVSKETSALSIPASHPPAPKPAPPLRKAKVVPRERSTINIPETGKPASVPPPPPAVAGVREVSHFFENYVNRYNSKSIDGLMSFFSPNAMQNEKDDFEKIRKIYGDFFRQMETVHYQIAINKIEPQQNRVEVRAQYQLEGTVAQGRKYQNWQGQIRWILVKENGVLKILSLDYQSQN